MGEQEDELETGREISHGQSHELVLDTVNCRHLRGERPLTDYKKLYSTAKKRSETGV